jgi:DNA polymerase I
VEWLLIRRAFEAGEIIPKLPGYDEIQRRRKVPPYTGGYVHEPSEGIHDNIALFDFQSLYPSITITHNISPETLNCRCCAGVKAARVPGESYHFCRKRRGFIPGVLEEIVDRRLSIRRMMARAEPGTLKYKTLYNRQNALKVLTNAIYGYYAYAGSRWYSRVCAQSIASWGRFYIKQVIQKARRMKLMVIYGDTDSLFLKVRYKKQAYDFLERANRSLPGVMELDLQGIYRSGIFVLSKTGAAAKKRYALLEPGGGIIIRGFEKVRRDWSAIARDTQERVLLAVLRDRSPEKALRIVRKTIEKLEGHRVGREDVMIHTQITRRLDDYEQVGPHVAAARKAEARGKSVPLGSTISYIITEGEGSISSRAMPAEYAGEYDPEYYVHNQVIPAALRVLSGLGYTKDDLLTDSGGQASLKGFLRK